MLKKEVEIFSEILASDKLGSFQNLQLLGANLSDDPSFVWQQLFMNPAYALLTFDDMEEKDGIVSACLETRRNGLLSKPRRIKPASESAEDKKIATFVEETLFDYMAFDAFLEEAYEAIPKGVSIGEKIFAAGRDRIYIERVKFHPQQYFTFGDGEFAEYSNLSIYRQTGPLRLRSGVTVDNWTNTLLPEDRFFVFSYRPRYGNRWGSPLDRKCYWASWMKRASAKQWLRYLEKGTGAVIARYNDGAAEAEQENALGAATAVVEESAVAIPKKFLLEVHEMVRSIGSSHKEFVDDYCKSEIAQTILGQTLTTRGSDGGGSRALGQVHQGVQDDRVETDARALMAAVNAKGGLVDNLVFYNFGAGKRRPEFIIEYVTPEDANSKAERFGTIKTKIGIELSKKQVREELELDEPIDEEDTLGAPTKPIDEDEAGDVKPPSAAFAEKKKIVRGSGVLSSSSIPSSSRTERFRRFRPSMIKFSDE
jgi:phage gp29-like protein